MENAVVHAFMNAINRQNVEDLAALMTADHVFIDGLGTRVSGRDQMKKAWGGYFGIVPDYTVTADETFSNGDVVVVLGMARGTYAGGGALKAENAWQTPAAWRAVVRDGQIAEWRVYADNEPIRQIMSRDKRGG